MWEEEALQANEVARKRVEQKILKLETQVKGLPEEGTNPAPVIEVQRREDQGINAGDPPAYVNNTSSLYPDLGAMGLLENSFCLPGLRSNFGGARRSASSISVPSV